MTQDDTGPLFVSRRRSRQRGGPAQNAAEWAVGRAAGEAGLRA
ncbi:hypothetical protein [Streptomyces sp. NPDC060027]